MAESTFQALLRALNEEHERELRVLKLEVEGLRARAGNKLVKGGTESALPDSEERSYKLTLTPSTLTSKNSSSTSGKQTRAATMTASAVLRGLEPATISSQPLEENKVVVFPYNQRSSSSVLRSGSLESEWPDGSQRSELMVEHSAATCGEDRPPAVTDIEEMRIDTRANSAKHLHHDIHVTRLVKLMDLKRKRDKCFIVSPEHLNRALRHRKAAVYTIERLESVLAHLNEVHSDVMFVENNAIPVPSRGINLNIFVQLMISKNLPQQVDPEFAKDVDDIQRALMKEDVKDVFHRLKEGGVKQGHRAPVVEAAHVSPRHVARRNLLIYIQGVIVTTCVILSVVLLAASIDNPWEGWIVLEGIFCTFFLLDMAINTCMAGCREYLCGEDFIFNWLDMITTMLACLDLTMAIIVHYFGTNLTLGGNIRIALIARTLRIARVARLVKLLRMPVMKQFIVMITGLLIGVPWLCWVTVLLAVVNFVLALVFRHALGPSEGQTLIEDCGGTVDEITSPGSVFPSNPKCRDFHILYGEEFFGTVSGSMFTVFRCMIGDCTTKNGQPLSMYFSEGYGVGFDFMYGLVMVFIIFGLFNVITAIFVDATMSGLRYSDTQKKFTRQYEAHYVANQLDALLKRICKLHDLHKLHGTESEVLGVEDEKDFQITEHLLEDIMSDSKINEIFTNLDVAILNRHNLWEMFDPDHQRISLSEFLSAIVRLRGDTKQSDVATLMAIRRMQQDFLDFRVFMLRSIKNEERMSQKILQTVDPQGGGMGFQHQQSFGPLSSTRGFQHQRSLERPSNTRGFLHQQTFEPLSSARGFQHQQEVIAV